MLPKFSRNTNRFRVERVHFFIHYSALNWKQVSRPCCSSFGQRNKPIFMHHTKSFTQLPFSRNVYVTVMFISHKVHVTDGSFGCQRIDNFTHCQKGYYTIFNISYYWQDMTQRTNICLLQHGDYFKGLIVEIGTELVNDSSIASHTARLTTQNLWIRLVETEIFARKEIASVTTSV